MKIKKILKLHSRPGHVQRRFNTCDWVVSDEDIDPIIHERNYWTHPTGRYAPKTPAQLHFIAMQSMDNSRYWIIQVTFTDFKEAEKQGEKFGFVPQKDFYCDIQNSTWFPIFDDIDKALVFVNSLSTEVEYVFE